MARPCATRTEPVLTANAADVERAVERGHGRGIVDRLTARRRRAWPTSPTPWRLVADLPDPVGEVVRGSTLPNGLELRQVRVPMGVVGDGLRGPPQRHGGRRRPGLKSGNAALLRGSSSAYDSNTALVAVMRDALAGAGLPADAVQLVPGASHGGRAR